MQDATPYATRKQGHKAPFFDPQGQPAMVVLCRFKPALIGPENQSKTQGKPNQNPNATQRQKPNNQKTK